MQDARLIFKDGAPYSLDFEDFYFNSNDGVAESEFIYTKAFEYGAQDSFIIAELGFGIGLNFFLSLERFERAKKRPQNLFYVSLELFYIPPKTLREIYQKLNLYERFKPNLERFLSVYPKKRDGIYRFYFKNFFLDLVFGKASAMLKELDFKAHVWFLDGFSPSKNPLMFDENVLKEVARLSSKNAQICTFSAASALKKSLEKLNFKVEKTKGFKKREMLKAYFLGADESEKKLEGYFTRPLNLKVNLKANLKESAQKNLKNSNSITLKNTPLKTRPQIAIIGAGIAGASLAYELSLRGFEIWVFDKADKIASAASGNESGILSALLLKRGVALGEFSQSAYYEASRFYKQVLNADFKGVYEFAYNEMMRARFSNQKDNVLFEMKEGAAFLKEGGAFKPREFVQGLLEKSGAKVFLEHEFTHFTRQNEQFSLNFKDKADLKGFDILIFAMGADTKSFLNYDEIKLSSVRGQVSLLESFLKTPFALSYTGYICPPSADLQAIGASYDRLNTSLEPLKSDDLANLDKAKALLNALEGLQILSQDEISKARQALKEPKFKGAKVAFRSYSSDRFPVVGAFYDESFYKSAYKALFWSKNKPQSVPQQHLNLYLSIALGSRGFAYAIFAARYITSLINNEPLGFEAKFIKEIHPARFLIRKLKKGL